MIAAKKWTLEHPEAIQEIQRGYVESGSQVIYAPTFGANRAKLKAYGLADKVEEFNRRLVALSREAANGRAMVAGDLSPAGLFLTPMGNTRFEELFELYAEQARALEGAGVDLYAVETMINLAEARAAVLAIRSVSEKPIFVSFTCDENGRTLTGTDITAALVVMQGMGVTCFGLNCSTGPEAMLKQLRRLQPLSRIPLIAKPNAGVPVVENGVTTYHCPPPLFTALTGEMAAAGVGVFGGCCGTDSSHIAALAASLPAVTVAPPAGRDDGLLPFSSEREPLFRVPDVGESVILPCDEDLEEALYDALEEAESVTVAIRAEGDLAHFEAAQFLITVPLFLACDDAALLERALRMYQGRAAYAGSLDRDALLPLAEKYGLILVDR